MATGSSTKETSCEARSQWQKAKNSKKAKKKFNLSYKLLFLQLECGIKNQLINTEYLKMKKLALTIAVVLTMGLSVYAQDGGLLNRGVSFDKQDRSLIKGDQDPPNHIHTHVQPLLTSERAVSGYTMRRGRKGVKSGEWRAESGERVSPSS